MAFEIDHDWEGNLATPTARIGEKAKIRLLILLCAIWILLGLIGHQPWKPEAETISIIQGILQHGNLLLLHASSDPQVTHPPLYYLVAAGFAKLFSGLLTMHDAARLSNAFWMSLTLLLAGMMGREIWGAGIGRQTTFILISCIGLISGSHLLIPAVAALTGLAMGFYALALSHRRPYRAAALLAGGIGISFLSTGLINALILLCCSSALPLLFANWRNKTFLTSVVLGLFAGSMLCAIWLVSLWHWQPEAANFWWLREISIKQTNFNYFFRTLAWFSWPALPLSIWGLWVYRHSLLIKPKFQLIIVFFMLSLFIICLAADTSETSAYALLIPMAVLASGSVEKLKRGAAGALNWFGLVLFGILGIVIWLGWIALNFGWPSKLNERMVFLSGINHIELNLLALFLAIFISLVWLITVNAKRSNRAAVTDWAVGITMAWSLLMSLWLPMLDSAKSYASVSLSMQKALPKRFNCINSIGLSSNQQNLFNYYLHQPLHASEWYLSQECNLLLVRNENRYSEITPAKNRWKLIWTDKRPAERHVYYKLYQKH